MRGLHSDHDRWQFAFSCPGSTAEVVQYVIDHGRPVSYATAARALGPALRRWATENYFDRHTPLSTAYYVGYAKSWLPDGTPVWVLDWSAMEQVFVPAGYWPDQARLTQIARETPRANAPAADYPRAGAVVSGLVVRDDVPNTESIPASLSRYEVLRGIREVPFKPGYKAPWTGSTYHLHRVDRLVEDIRASGEINPLIIVEDGHPEGYYVLEGSHRFDALQILGLPTFPALVVIDLDDAPRENTRKSHDAILATPAKALRWAVDNIEEVRRDIEEEDDAPRYRALARIYSTLYRDARDAGRLRVWRWLSVPPGAVDYGLLG